VTPISWEGWAVVVAYVAVVLAGVLVIAQRNTGMAWLSAIAVIAVATGAMVFVGRQKTDGDWRWRWGNVDKSGKVK